MKVSDRTTNLLKNYANINQSIEFREGKLLKTVSPLNTNLASVEIEEEFPQTFPIYELNRFLGTLSLFNNPELDFTDNGVSITDDNHKAIYRYCGSSSMFQTPPDKDITFPDAEISFKLSQDQFKKTINAANTLGLPEIVVEGNGSEILFVVSDTGNPSSDQFSTKVGSTDKTFSMIFKTENPEGIPCIWTGYYPSKSMVRFRRNHFHRKFYYYFLKKNQYYLLYCLTLLHLMNKL